MNTKPQEITRMKITNTFIIASGFVFLMASWKIILNQYQKCHVMSLKEYQDLSNKN